LPALLHSLTSLAYLLKSSSDLMFSLISKAIGLSSEMGLGDLTFDAVDCLLLAPGNRLVPVGVVGVP